MGPTLINFGHAKLNPDSLDSFEPPRVAYDFPSTQQQQNRMQQYGTTPLLNIELKLDGLTYSSNTPSVKQLNLPDQHQTNFLAVRNKKTNKIKLIEANTITLGAVTTPPASTNPVLLEQELKQQEVELGDNNKTAPSSEQKKADDKLSRNKNLVREFGQTKGRRMNDQNDRMQINPEVLQDKLSKAAMSAEKSLLEQSNTPMDMMPTCLTPPCNRNATEKELVYSLENGILNQSELAKLQAAATSLAEEYCSDELIKVGIYKKDFSELFGKILLREHKEIESINLAIAIHMEAIIQFIGLQRRDFSKGPKGLPNFIPLDIREKVFRTFTNDQNNVVPTTKDSAICYVIVLALMINRYRIAFSDLTSSIRVKADQLQKLIKLTGARIFTDANKTYVELKIPLETFDPTPFARKKNNPYKN